MKNIYIIAVAFLISLSFSACNDYLEQLPDDRTVLDSPEKVRELLVTAYVDGTYIEFCEAMSDNVGDKSANANMQTLANEQAYFWRTVTNTDNGTPVNYWRKCYHAIAVANAALEAIDNASNPEDYQASKGEALLCRAYHHYMLASVFCQRYNAYNAETDLGIPYVTEPESTVFGNYERKTMAYVFEKIREDLEVGLPLISDDNYEIPKYHFTESAAYAFASRFYLTIGEWEKSLTCANRVLGTSSEDKIRDWAYYKTLPAEELLSIYTNSTENANVLMAGAITTIGRYSGIYRFALTIDIHKSLYDESVSGGTWLYSFFGNSLTLRMAKFKEHFKLTSINANTGYPYVMVPLITMEEALFNRAEALVMLGKYDEAVVDINTFLSKRIKDYNSSNNYVSDTEFEDYYSYSKPDIDPWYETSRQQDVWLRGILDLRRKEFIQEGVRWFDIKRFNMVVERVGSDNKTLDILIKNDYRRAVQIPEAAIKEGMTANPR